MSYLCGLLIFVSTLTQIQACCFPSQFEGTRFALVSSLGQTTPTTLRWDMFHFSFDANRMMVVDSGTSKENDITQNVTIYSDLRTQTQYVVVNGKCSKRRLRAFGGICLPDNVPQKNTFYGLLSNSSHSFVTANTYYFFANQMQISISVDEYCLPNLEAYFGESNKLKVLGNVFYQDITMGIKDTNRFIMPNSCNIFTDETNTNEMVAGILG